MNKISITLIISILSFSFSISANDTIMKESTISKGDILSLNDLDKGPGEYIVKEGDTLWDISSDKIEDNFLWPKLWKFNPQVKNPDLIYPGDIITIPSREELMGVSPKISTKPIAKRSKPVIMAPETIPPKYLIDKDFYASLSWIEADYPGIGEIMQSPTGRNVFGKHDTVYIKTDEEFSKGEKFLAIQKVKTVKHPRTNKELGFLINISGILEVTGKVDGYYEAYITRSYLDTKTGDSLIPFMETLPPVVPDVIMTPDIGGYIVESYLSMKMTSKRHIVYLDKGINDGMGLGDTFTVFSDGAIRAAKGTLQIVSLKPETSTAIVIKSSRELLIGDSWGNK